MSAPNSHTAQELLAAAKALCAKLPENNPTYFAAEEVERLRSAIAKEESNVSA